MISEFIFIALLALVAALGAYNSIRHFQRTWVAGGGDPRQGWRRGVLSIIGALGGTIVFMMILGAAYHAFSWPGALIVSGASIALWVVVHSTFFTPPQGTGEKHLDGDETPAPSRPDDPPPTPGAQTHDTDTLAGGA